jgi:hypothetical protein
MAVDHLTVAAGQHGTLEAEFPEAAAHAIHSSIVLARVASIEDEPVDGPALNLQGLWRGRPAGLPGCGTSGFQSGVYFRFRNVLFELLLHVDFLTERLTWVFDKSNSRPAAFDLPKEFSFNRSMARSARRSKDCYVGWIVSGW